MQGVIKAYDPVTQDGVLLRDTDLSEYDLSPNALDNSVFRMLRPGQRVVFDLDEQGQAVRLRLGSEVDMGTPSWIDEGNLDDPEPRNAGYPADSER